MDGQAAAGVMFFFFSFSVNAGYMVVKWTTVTRLLTFRRFSFD